MEGGICQMKLHNSKFKGWWESFRREGSKQLKMEKSTPWKQEVENKNS